MPLIPNHPFIAKARPRFANCRSASFRDLPGFKKGHSVPKLQGPATESFLHQIVDQELRTEFQSLHHFLRNHFALKRREIEITLEGNGTAILESKVLRFQKQFSADSQTPEHIHEITCLDEISDLNLLADPNFENGFGYKFEKLVLSIEQPLDLELLIDRFEDLAESRQQFKLDYDFEATHCEIQIPGLSTTFSFHDEELRLESAIPRTGSSLIRDFAQYQVILNDALSD